MSEREREHGCKKWRVKTHVGTFSTYAANETEAIDNIRHRFSAVSCTTWTATEDRRTRSVRPRKAE